MKTKMNVIGGATVGLIARPASRWFPYQRLALAAVILAIALADPASAAPMPQEAQAAAMGAPVNLYARRISVYGSEQDGDIHPWHAKGQVWLMAGEPGQSNVAVQVGDEGVLVVDTGTQAMAPRLLTAIRQLAREHAGDQKEIRLVVDTNGLADHIGGNAVIRAAGDEIVAGEEAAQQEALGTRGAEVLAEQNVLTRLSQGGAGEAYSQALWPTDAEDFDIYNSYFNGEAVQLYHPHQANTDGQLMVQFRQSDVIAAGDVVDMNTYPIIDVARGGTIDGELVALNKLMDLAVPARQVEGGTVAIPGHGRLCDVSDVAQYTIMVTTLRDRVQFYRNQGKTLQQILDLKPSWDYDQRWGGEANDSWGTQAFISAVYRTLPAKGPIYFEMHTATSVPRIGNASRSKLF